jgi:hypothetical protein
MRSKLKIKECSEAPDHLEDEDGNAVRCPMGQIPNANKCKTNCAWFKETVEKDRPHFYCKNHLIGFGQVHQCIRDAYDEENS